MSILQQHRAGRQGVTPDPTPPITAAELAEVTAADATRAGHILATVWTMVMREAPGAPEAIQREAIIRFAGYLTQSDFGGIESETIGPRTVAYTVNHSAMFRNSGAKGLLAPWKIRRAGAIG